MKTCTVCKEGKPLSDYYNCRSSKDGKSYRCKSCDGIARKTWADNNPKRQMKSLRGRHLKHKYGITIEDYEKILVSQNGVCAICGCTSEDAKRVKGSFAVDHCHITGEVRGLLCNQCNRAIGMLNDDPTLLARAVNYLRDSETH